MDIQCHSEKIGPFSIDEISLIDSSAVTRIIHDINALGILLRTGISIAIEIICHRIFATIRCQTVTGFCGKRIWGLGRDFGSLPRNTVKYSIVFSFSHNIVKVIISRIKGCDRY